MQLQCAKFACEKMPKGQRAGTNNAECLTWPVTCEQLANPVGVQRKFNSGSSVRKSVYSSVS
jgi:hypothetical protein